MITSGWQEDAEMLKTVLHRLVQDFLHGWYLHLVVVGELEYPSDPESYAAGSVATGRVTLGGQVEG